MYLRYIRQYAQRLDSKRLLPQTKPAWVMQRQAIRRALQQSWGGKFPRQPAPLEPRVVERLPRDGYRLEKLLFQTWPGVTMAAHAYVPDGKGPFPAVLCVHGHWPLAKQEPRVQARSIGLAKLGFFVLAVDAFGAGERGIEPALGEYHGATVASTLWPTGRPLSGIQVYENMRAVDYLQSRAEVAEDRIGITGTSGGGNQTMYAGAWDERLRCVVPVCSVGSYQAYLGAACCMCEVVPSALTYTEEWGILGLVAPRPLLVINATRDAVQFSVQEAQQTVKKARAAYNLYDCGELIKQLPIDSVHDYNQPMREAMYGWMTRHLKDEGDGTPIPEPPLQTEDPQALRCWPERARPRTFVTLPQFAGRLARNITMRNQPPVDISHWETERLWRREGFGRVFAESTPLPETTVSGAPVEAGKHQVVSEPGISVAFERRLPSGVPRKRLLLLDLDRDAGGTSSLIETALAQRIEVVTVNLRATLQSAPPEDRIGQAVDHNSAQWGLWVGRPLLTQWVRDVRSVLNVLPQDQLAVGLAGVGSAGMVALCSAVADRRIGEVVLLDSPLTMVTDDPLPEGRVGILVPGMLGKIGDVPQLIALCSPRRILVAGGRSGAGTALAPPAQEALTAYPRQVYRLAAASAQLVCHPAVDENAIGEWLVTPGGKRN
ncbi:MAG: alpha/beta hydrolase family protein [Planctomycetota bacterium]|nr:alpha/beta hydrolase family protein [Planctomycetota bacterium]